MLDGTGTDGSCVWPTVGQGSVPPVDITGAFERTLDVNHAKFAVRMRACVLAPALQLHTAARGRPDAQRHALCVRQHKTQGPIIGTAVFSRTLLKASTHIKTPVYPNAGGHRNYGERSHPHNAIFVRGPAGAPGAVSNVSHVCRGLVK